MISSVTNIKTHWRQIAIILLPWLVVAAAFNWMATAFPTYHGNDEPLFHYPIIQRFFAQLPYPDIRDYNSATGPLFHVLFAFLAKVVGLSLQSLRLVNIAVSLACVFVFYGLVSRLVQRNEALLLALVFGLSPYFFGASFILLTDNIGILFALLAMRALYRSLESAETRHWVALCVWVCLATLTRQLYVWLALGAVLTLIVRHEPLRSGVLKTASLVAACLPLAALVIVWGGLVPPTFQERHVATALITPYSGVFGIAMFGLYWVALYPDRVIDVLRRLPSQRFLPLALALAATGITLLAIPTNPADGADGIMWRISRMTPVVMGTPILFWLLVPAGLLFFWNALGSKDPVSTATLLLAFAFLVCNLPNARVYEKYYDPFIIIFVILIERAAQSSGMLTKVSRALLLCAFVAYPYVHWRFFPTA